MQIIKIHITLLLIAITSIGNFSLAQHSVARQWNEVLLDAIRKDFARPTVHARNLHHVSIAMYDAWAAYDEEAATYLLGDTIGDFICLFEGVPLPSQFLEARNEAISFAAYRLLYHRFKNSPGKAISLPEFDSLFTTLGYDSAFTSVNYTTGSPAALGNYIAQCLINFGLQDNSNEQNDYENTFYAPRNPTLLPIVPGNPDIEDPNAWQPLTLDVFIDQSGNPHPNNTPDFLSPEWGTVTPFALQDSNLTIYERAGNNYWVYHDPGGPALIDTTGTDSAASADYKWNFSLVSIWSSHLNPADTTVWDISPKSIGNVQVYPTTIPELQNFYNYTEGGDPGTGRTINPHTGMPYEPQPVLRSDYTRVLAEFWADGPHSETPPGHWFTILNYVNDHAEFTKKYRGAGEPLDDLEWDVKAYFTLSGAVHDAAIAAWGIKGWYDYLRPISAIRYMADNGQCSDTSLMSYNKNGIPLVDDYIELVLIGDPLAGNNNENVGKIKVFAWKGPDYINNSDTDVAGVGWILAENWWPYQRPTFVTPPFAGYISGHSTFSRAAAEVLTFLSGDPFFPGGIGEFIAEKDKFLVFEQGPSEDVVLQWATYRDASDQCSLSRIWGGIHPPVDDMPGRLIGKKIGVNAFNFAEKYFYGKDSTGNTRSVIYPTACDSYTSPSGKMWNISGIYLDTIPNAANADSIITIDLTVSASSESTIDITRCNSFTSPSGNYTWTTSGTYLDTISNANGCDSVISIGLTIPEINTTILQEGDTLIAEAVNANYQWITCPNNVPLHNDTNQTFIGLEGEEYAIIINQQGCSDTSECFTIRNTGFTKYDLRSTNFVIFPNPATDQLQVQQLRIQHSELKIIDLPGKLSLERL